VATNCTYYVQPPYSRTVQKKLEERLRNLGVLSSRVSGAEGCFKIKLRSVGYRLVYQVIEKEVVVLVLAVCSAALNRV
jgi:mRNA interferase RelE/StbE